MKKRTVIILSSIILAAVLTVGIIFISAPSSSPQVFSDKTTINGVDISGLTKSAAREKLTEYIEAQAQEVTLDIVYKDKVWSYNGANFQPSLNVREIIDNIYKKGKSGKYFQNIAKSKNTFTLDNMVALNYYFKDIDEKLDAVIAEIEQPMINSEIKFHPNKDKMFEVTKSNIGIVVDREQLVADIIAGLKSMQHIVVYVQVNEILPEVTEEALNRCKKKQAVYSTGYSKSSKERKNNIKIATDALNGLRLEPNIEYSFNELIGPRTGKHGYKEANIIMDGRFERGIGGGVCQVSTTLYNALLLSGIKVTEVHNHTLPISYVPPARDAMVSWGSADLKFINTSKLPVFIKASTIEDKTQFEIYGTILSENEHIEIRSEKTKKIPHNGDKIISDTKGKYDDKIMFKGEYVREKFPQEGYEAKSYLQRFVNGKLVSETLIRHEKYASQQGIVYEGADELFEGMTLPPSSVKIIGPQKLSET